MREFKLLILSIIIAIIIAIGYKTVEVKACPSPTAQMVFEKISKEKPKAIKVKKNKIIRVSNSKIYINN